MLDTLRRDGIARIESLTARQADDIIGHFTPRPVYNAHVVAKATEPPVACNQALSINAWPAFSHPMVDAVTAPYLLERALELLPLAQEYFDGEPPLVYSMNAFWTQPAPGVPQYQDTHGWHRDGDDRKQLVLFIFGTDVTDAVHRYQLGSHRVSDGELGRDFRAPPPEVVETVAGPRGTAFLTDTSGLHIGARPGTSARLLLWARFGVSDPPESYIWDKLEPVDKALLGGRYPSDPAQQAAIRLICR